MEWPFVPKKVGSFRQVQIGHLIESRRDLSVTYVVDACGSNLRHLDIRLGSSSVYHKTNRETMVEIHESVRGKDVYIIQTGTK